jgi:RNA polymerase sigma factor (TIGR02999 family)
LKILIGRTRRQHIGDAAVSPSFDSILYRELKRLATSRLRTRATIGSIHPTVLAHEAFLRLSKTWPRATGLSAAEHTAFYAAVSEAMRSVVIDYYRRKNSLKRGRGVARLRVDVDSLAETDSGVDILALNEALDDFEASHPLKAQLVKLRFFAGMSMPECATAIGVSLPTAERYWRYARAWLAERLESS